MDTTRAPDPFERIAARVIPGGALRRSWRLTGGVSADVTALEVARPDGTVKKLLVRRHGPVDLAGNPHIARDEFRLLEIAQAYGLAAPRPWFYDESGSILPSPFIVIDFVEGETVFEPTDLAGYTEQLAMHLARIHSIPDSPELAFLPRLGRGFGERPEQLDESMQEGSIRDALGAAWPVTQRNPATLLHGDYWPGNLLWRDGVLVAVIDWEDARVGDPLADVAICRQELAMFLGDEAVVAFTGAYQSRAPLDYANLAYWDLCAALRPCGKLAEWGLDPDTEARMRAGHARFVTQALEELARG